MHAERYVWPRVIRFVENYRHRNAEFVLLYLLTSCMWQTKELKGISAVAYLSLYHIIMNQSISKV